MVEVEYGIPLDEVDPELYAEQLLAEQESYRWGQLSEDMWSLYSKVCDLRDDSNREAQSEYSAKYDKLEGTLAELCYYVDGQLQQFNPGSIYLHPCYRYNTKYKQELIEFELQEGINSIAMEQVYDDNERREIQEYIAALRLASRDYETTLRTIEEVKKQWR